MSITALLVIDMQTGLLNREVCQKEILIENVNKLSEMFHAFDKTVLWTRHTNTSFSKAETPEWQMDKRLAVSASDPIIDKTHSSIFKEKAFLSLLKEREIGHIVVCGLVTNGCVQAACQDALKYGLAVTLAADAHSTWNKDAKKIVADWNEKLKEMGVEVLPAQEITAEIAVI